MESRAVTSAWRRNFVCMDCTNWVVLKNHFNLLEKYLVKLGNFQTNIWMNVVFPLILVSQIFWHVW